jgi:hypothetical protein
MAIRQRRLRPFIRDSQRRSWLLSIFRIALDQRGFATILKYSDRIIREAIYITMLQFPDIKFVFHLTVFEKS